MDSAPLETILLKNRKIPIAKKEEFFSPNTSHLHDPYLLPDMKKGVERILVAKEKQERIIIF
jgi:single-stranded-DNA-specific exonuclease